MRVRDFIDMINQNHIGLDEDIEIDDSEYDVSTVFSVERAEDGSVVLSTNSYSPDETIPSNVIWPKPL